MTVWRERDKQRLLCESPINETVGGIYGNGFTSRGKDRI